MGRVLAPGPDTKLEMTRSSSERVKFNSQLEGMPAVSAPGRHRCRISLPDIRLSEGEYTVVGYLFDEHGVHMYDHRQTLKNLLRALTLNLELRARYRVFEFEASQDGHAEIATDLVALYRALGGGWQ